MGKDRFRLFILIFVLVAWGTACKQGTYGPVVQAVYPSSNVLPENLLRIYVQFSHPMKTTGNLERIRLMDAHGRQVENVFFNNVYELWNTQQTQLTLILDPARVKTGLRANEEWGRAIRAQNKYTLVIEGLEDVHHQKMPYRFEKDIHVVRADLKAPDLGNWMLTIPRANSLDDFILRFEGTLDYNSMQRRLAVTTLHNRPIKGSIRIDKQETVWRFRPVSPWVAGEYLLQVNARLEDPSGNNLNGLFDHKIGSLKYAREGVVEQLRFKIN